MEALQTKFSFSWPNSHLPSYNQSKQLAKMPYKNLSDQCKGIYKHVSRKTIIDSG